MKPMLRRKFLQQTSILTIGSIAAPQIIFGAQKLEIKKIRVGLIGVGLRGQNHLDVLLRREDVLVTALADPQPKMLAMANELIAKSGKPKPLIFSNGNYDYKNLLKRDDVDAVIISTPWEWHAEQTIDS
ncbi:MAG TPA: Gfo/Idh/MocA family oxidoreductase, partial [Chitinophagaceae bacterium]|nr:Gfo/Idh/MocA family oxidoreductase [Chitinophagaceae bacterium]